jgi:spore coat polysaccharide biosynthesis protein SpsF
VHRVVIVQARMTSTRLPGKVLMDLAGRPLLERQLERLRRCERADEIVLAVTTNAADDPLVELARRLGLRWHRGSEYDVLERYAGAAREAGADVVVRVTADCPLIDPSETDAVIAAVEGERCDYASNILERTLPRGLDTEALWRDVLERTHRLAASQPAREHVTWFVHSERPDLFVLHSVRRPYDAADLRWTVDTPQDLALVRRLYDDLGLAERPVALADVIAHVRAHPELAAMNAKVAQKDPTA